MLRSSSPELESSMPMSPLLRRIVLTFRALATLSLAAIVLEGGAFFALRFLDWRRSRILGSVRAALPAEADQPWPEGLWREQLQVIHADYEAYGLWRSREYAGQHINVDASGIRRTVHSDCSDADSPTLWLFGGSTMWGFGATDEQTIPSELAALLAAAGRPSCVVNLGEDSWRSETSLVALLLALKTSARRPDVVVFLDGCNDVLTPLFLTGRADREWSDETSRHWFNFAAQRKRGSLTYLSGANTVTLAARLAARIRTPVLPVPLDRLDELASEIAAAYLSNAEALQALAHGYGFAAHSLWQPLGVTGHKRLTAAERDGIGRQLGAWFEASSTLAPQVEQLVARSGAPGVRSLSSAFDPIPESLYFDACHIRPSGNRLLAAEILSIVDASPPGSAGSQELLQAPAAARAE